MLFVPVFLFPPAFSLPTSFLAPVTDAAQHFPVDDVTEPLTLCELHIPQENATVMVATGVVSPIDRTKTPKIHNSVIPLGYAAVSVDKF